MSFSLDMMERHDEVMKAYKVLNDAHREYFVTKRAKGKGSYTINTSMLLFLLANPPEEQASKEALEFIQAHRPDKGNEMRLLLLQIKNKIYSILQEKTGWGKNELWIKLEKMIDETYSMAKDADPDLEPNSDSEVPF